MRRSTLLAVGLIAGALALMTTAPNSAQARGCPCNFWETLLHLRKTALSVGTPIPDLCVKTIDSVVQVHGYNENATISLVTAGDTGLDQETCVLSYTLKDARQLPGTIAGFIQEQSARLFDYSYDSSAAATCEWDLQSIIRVKRLEPCEATP